MNSVKAAGLFRPKTIEMVFIDASHEYQDFKADLLGWLPICRKLIGGHDIGYQSVRQAVEELGKPYSVIGSNWSIEL
jgi:hypothetical protein